MSRDFNNKTNAEKIVNYPVLYSFRRCPYAIRARLALAYAGIQIELREILLRDKPQSMLNISPKGTVPVLQLRQGRILDESLEIMHWALAIRDTNHWRKNTQTRDGYTLIAENDTRFKYFLDRYKYADRYPEYPPTYYRQQAEEFLIILERRLQSAAFLCGNHYSLTDAAIFPFIRQFSNVDEPWFAASQYAAVQAWLKQLLASSLFLSVMKKYPPWSAQDTALLLDFNLIHL